MTEVEDYLEPEVAIAVATTALLASPQVRGVLRRGLVLGMAGAMMAGDTIMSFGRGAKRSSHDATTRASSEENTSTIPDVPMEDTATVEEFVVTADSVVVGSAVIGGIGDTMVDVSDPMPEEDLSEPFMVEPDIMSEQAISPDVSEDEVPSLAEVIAITEETPEATSTTGMEATPNQEEHEENPSHGRRRRSTRETNE